MTKTAAANKENKNKLTQKSVASFFKPALPAAAKPQKSEANSSKVQLASCQNQPISTSANAAPNAKQAAPETAATQFSSSRANPPDAIAPQPINSSTGIRGFLVSSSSSDRNSHPPKHLPIPFKLPAAPPPLPSVGEDTDPIISAISKPLVTLACVSDDASGLHAPIYVPDDCITTDASVEEPSISSDEEAVLGAQGCREAQFWLDAYANFKIRRDARCIFKIGDQTLTVWKQCRDLNVQEMMDLQMVVDFVEGVGGEFMKEVGNWRTEFEDLTLESLHGSLTYSTSEKNSLHTLLHLYKSLILTIHPDRTWKSLATNLHETPALVIHHLLKTSATSTDILESQSCLRRDRPSLSAFVSIFAGAGCAVEAGFPCIPAPIHVSMLAMIVSHITASVDAFARFLSDAGVARAASARTKRAAGVKRKSEVKGLMKSVEAEAIMLRAVVVRLEKGECTFEGGSVEGGAGVDGIAVAGNENTDESSTTVTAGIDTLSVEERLGQTKKQLSQKQAELKTLAKELAAIDAQDLAIQTELNKLGSFLRVSRRMLGHDRDGCSYVWIDFGKSDALTEESVEALKNETAAANKIETRSSVQSEPKKSLLKLQYLSTFGILVFPAPTITTGTSLQNQHQKIKYVDSLDTLKQLIRTLNDRGIRERNLLTALRDNLKPYKLEILNISTTSIRKAQEQLGCPESEAVVDSGLQLVARVLQSLAAVNSDDKDCIISQTCLEYHDGVLEGVRDRLTELSNATEFPDLAYMKSIAKMTDMRQFINAVFYIIEQVYNTEEAKEAVERFEGVTNWALFSVAIGFVVKDVLKGKMGARKNNKEAPCDRHDAPVDWVECVGLRPRQRKQLPAFSFANQVTRESIFSQEDHIGITTKVSNAKSKKLKKRGGRRRPETAVVRKSCRKTEKISYDEVSDDVSNSENDDRDTDSEGHDESAGGSDSGSEDNSEAENETAEIASRRKRCSEEPDEFIRITRTRRFQNPGDEKINETRAAVLERLKNDRAARRGK